MTVMVLMALTADPFQLSGESCPYPGCTCKHVSCEHAVGCCKQNMRSLTTKGHNNIKRAFQDIRNNGVRMLGNEDTDVVKNLLA
jgi:hypothetical protein